MTFKNHKNRPLPLMPFGCCCVAQERHVVSVLTFQWQDIEDIVNHVHEKYFPDQPPSATLHAKVERVIEELHGEGEVEERLTPSGSLYYRLPSSKSIFSSPTQSLGSPSSSLLQVCANQSIMSLYQYGE